MRKDPYKDPLTQMVAEEWGPLIEKCSLQSTVQTSRWGTTVTLEGAEGWLEFFYGNPEFDFTAELRFRQLPRKSPRPVWALLQAAGIDPSPLGPATMVGEDEVRRQVAAAAELLGCHWSALQAEPPRELLRKADRILDRYARSLRYP